MQRVGKRLEQREESPRDDTKRGRMHSNTEGEPVPLRPATRGSRCIYNQHTQLAAALANI